MQSVKLGSRIASTWWVMARSAPADQVSSIIVAPKATGANPANSSPARSESSIVGCPITPNRPLSLSFSAFSPGIFAGMSSPWGSKSSKSNSHSDVYSCPSTVLPRTRGPDDLGSSHKRSRHDGHRHRGVAARRPLISSSKLGQPQ